MPTAVPTTVQLVPFSGSLGAEIRGLDLCHELDERDVDLIWSAVARHQVVIIRGQCLSPSEQTALAGRFGSIATTSVKWCPSGPHWRTDRSWSTRPPALGFLNAFGHGSAGIDAVWVSTVALARELPPSELHLAGQVRVTHRPDDHHLQSVAATHGVAAADDLARWYQPVDRPILVNHPLAGGTSL